MGGRRGARPPLGSPAPSRAGLEGGKEETPHTPRQTDGQNRHPAQPPGRLPLTCCADAGSGLRRVTHVVQSFLTGLGRVGWGTFILPAPPPLQVLLPLPLTHPCSLPLLRIYLSPHLPLLRGSDSRAGGSRPPGSPILVCSPASFRRSPGGETVCLLSVCLLSGWEGKEQSRNRGGNMAVSCHK